jgi:predicted amidohydrolase YtcJ
MTSMNDLVLLNARIITMNTAMPLANFLVITNGIITEVAQGEAPTDVCNGKKGKVIDCAGMTAVPGFIDAHCHVVSYAGSLIGLDLSPDGGIVSVSGIQEKVAEAAGGCPRGTWIRGKRYNEFYLFEKRHPNRHDLDAAAPFHPVRLSHRSGHAHVLNTIGLRLVGITAETGDPPDGLIERDLETGEPTGVLFGMSAYLAERIPPLDEAQLEVGVSRVNEKLLSCGITSVCDASAHNGLHQWEQFKGWVDRGIFQPRLTVMTSSQSADLVCEHSALLPHLADRLQQGPVKIVIQHVTGRMSPRQDELNKLVHTAHEAGRQVAIHAVEPAEIDAACDAIEKALQKTYRVSHCHRIEHCSVCPQPLLERIRRLGITVVTQPSFVYFHGDRYLATVAVDELSYLYRTGSMMSAGIPVAGSSDFPMTDPNPFFGMYGAISRKTKGGQFLLCEEAITPGDALAIFATNAAASCRKAHTIGSIEPGKFGDLVILDGDPLPDNLEKIRDIKVNATIIGGQVAWNRAGSIP